MTTVAFHLQVNDKLAYGCRLLRKAVSKGSRLVVTADADALARLDQVLWTFSATDFVPHCTLGTTGSVLRKSPVLLAQTLQGFAPQGFILLNLGSQVPVGFTGFERIIELVANDDDERRLARQRWKHYLNAGVQPVKFDLDQPNNT